MARPKPTKGPKPTDPEVRFWRHVEITESCWYWTGYSNYGYGYVANKQGRGRTRAHRLAYEMFVGSIPQDQIVHHICGVKTCVNPEHLQAMTQTEHMNQEHPDKKMVGGTKPLKMCRRSLHPMSGDNLYVNPRGQRCCRACKQARRPKEYAKRRAKKTASA